MPSTSSHSSGGLYGRLVEVKPQGVSKYRSMDRDLAMFGARDLYEYACPAGVADAYTADPAALIARTEERVGDYRRDTSERSAAERLCSRAHEVFGDEVDQRRYNDYLQWLVMKTVFDVLDRELDQAAGAYTSEDVDGELTVLANLLGSRSQAEALMESYLEGRGLRFERASMPAKVARDETVSTPQGRAKVRQELSAQNVLPDSALKPSTPDPYERDAGYNVTRQVQVMPDTYGSGGVGQRAVPVQLTVQCGACGAMNMVGQDYCQACMAPLTRRVNTQGGGYTGTGPLEPPRREVPVAAVVVIALVAIVLACVAACAALNSINSGETVSNPATREKQVTSGAVDPVACSKGTRIIPINRDGNEFTDYRVEIFKKPEGDSLAIFSMRGDAGFTFAELIDKGLGNLEAGQYEVVMTESKAGGDEHRFTVRYEGDKRDAFETVEVVSPF